MPSLDHAADPASGTADTGCVGCDSEETDSYDLVLDGVTPVSIRLCEECYRECYESILAADWVEEPT